MAQLIDITVNVVKDIPSPATGRAEYKDKKTPGLYLRVTSKGVKTFSFVGRAKGSSRVERVTLGKYPAVRPEEARRRAVVLSGELASGTSAAAALRGRREEMTLKAAAELYMESLERRSPKNTARSTWTLHIEPEFGARRMSEITAASLERWHRALPEKIVKRVADESAARERAKTERRAAIVEAQGGRRRGPEPKPRPPSTSTRSITGLNTANQALVLVGTIYNWAAKSKQAYYVGPNPAAGHALFGTDERERFLRPKEMAPFFTALATEPSESMRDFIILALLTGARRSNVAAMPWADLDLENAEWRVAGAFMKNGEPQTITLTPEAVEILRGRKKGSKSPWVFPSDRSPTGHITDPRKAWERVMRASGLSNLRLHDLRRTLGSWQARTGASLLLIGKSLNHKSHEATAIYARLDLDPVRQSVDRATTAMFEAAGVKPAAEVVEISGRAAKAKRIAQRQ